MKITKHNDLPSLIRAKSDEEHIVALPKNRIKASCPGIESEAPKDSHRYSQAVIAISTPLLSGPPFLTP